MKIFNSKFFKIKNNRIIYFNPDELNPSVFILPIANINNLFCIDNEIGYFENGRKIIIATYDNNTMARGNYWVLCKSIYQWNKKQGILTILKSIIKWVLVPFISAILIISLYSTILQSIAFQQFYFSNLTARTQFSQKYNYEPETQQLRQNNENESLDKSLRKQNSIIGTKQLATILEDGTKSNEFTINLENPSSKTKLFVFSDPLCPYCKKLDKILDEVKSDYSVYIFPVNVISHELVLDNLAEITCEPNIQRKLDLWHSLINETYSLVDVQNKKICVDRIEANSKVFSSLNVPGTPAVFNENGVQIPNSVLNDSANLKNWISKNGQ
jgi:TrbB protein